MGLLSKAAQGEDLWIAGYFPLSYHGYAVDVGAYDGLMTNNTLFLEKSLGWKVICVEPNPRLTKDLMARREIVEVCACDAVAGEDVDFTIVGGPWEDGGFTSLRPILSHPVQRPPKDGKDTEKIKVKVETLNSLLDKHQFPRLDALSVDTEGTEVDVLKGLDWEKWTPLCVVTESWDDHGPCVAFLEARGYRRMQRAGVNDLFLRMTPRNK